MKTTTIKENSDYIKSEVTSTATSDNKVVVIRTKITYTIVNKGIKKNNKLCV
jgi:hypothetical protein